jgi:hypothetical protein
MAKRDMKKALGASLKAEEQAVRSRFEKAKTVQLETMPVPREVRQPETTVQVVRSDNCNIPDDEDELISRIKKRCMKAGISINKNKILRAGLAALDAMPDRELKRHFENSLPVKTGRPAREILTFIIHRADIVKFQRRLQIKRSPSARQVLIGHKIATITAG